MLQSTNKNNQGFASVVLILIIVVVVIAGGAFYFMQNKTSPASPFTPPSQKTSTPDTTTTTQKWTETGVAVAGKYADADVVDIGGGKFRMYYSEEPEVAGFQGRVYSSTSTDGETWTQETGVRKTMSTFPDVVKLSNGTWRMYFQNAGSIKSATSTDGLTWTDEQGTRIDTQNNAGLKLDNVAAPTTLQLPDGSFIMVYRGSIAESYKGAQVPNKTMGVLLWAKSKDGLTWEKQGLAVDTRTSKTLEGWADGPDLVTWDEQVKVFFMGYKGVFESSYTDGKFSEPTNVYRGANVDERNMYPPNPPGDPTLIKIGDTWNMYYGQHQKGQYRAVLGE